MNYFLQKKIVCFPPPPFSKRAPQGVHGRKVRSVPLLEGRFRGYSDGLGRGVAERDGVGADAACG